MIRSAITRTQSTVVATLLGHKQLPVALPCLRSLLQQSADSVSLRLHDDGSLDDGDIERLGSELGSVTLVMRSEADLRADAMLAGYPNTRAFRSQHALALKLVDLWLFGGESIVYCDADVLFLRPFRGLFRPGPAPRAVFMSDVRTSYSIKSWQLLRLSEARPIRDVNTGIILFPTNGYDPDRVEWFLGRPELHSPPVWAEQTCWAFLAAGVPCEILSPAQFAIASHPPKTPVALHFVTPSRHLIADYLRPMDAGPLPVDVAFVPARQCTPGSLLASEIARRVARMRAAVHG